MEDDREWSRIEDELRRQPDVNRAAIASILMEVRRPRREPWHRRAWAWVTEPSLTLSPIGALATAAVVVVGAVAIASRGVVLAGGGMSAPAVTATAPPSTTVLPASSVPHRQDVQFVLVDNSASDVRIVGDFNDWDSSATPMQRTGSGGVWSVVVPLEPGRHVYAFVVDGKQWIADVAAPRAPENAFGTPNSIVMVGGSS